MTQIVKGKRVSAEVWELSPLDLSIDLYEKRCKDYFYRIKKQPGETPEQRQSRLDELKKTKKLLDLEASRIQAMISIEEQIKLREYQDEFRNKSEAERVNLCRKEEHHPTTTLENNLRRAGRPQPSRRCSAHHIVEGVGKLKTSDTKRARMRIFTHNIRINDPDNGIWMPMTDKDMGHWGMRKCVPHARIHTENYERWVWKSIQPLHDEQSIRFRLGLIRTALHEGRQPLNCTTDTCNKKFGLKP
ncbi:AHH domain-containing protein [Microbulbifer agarilyticus]